jgi:hypothetical protein
MPRLPAGVRLILQSRVSTCSLPTLYPAAIQGNQAARTVPLQMALDHDCWLDRPKSVRFAKTEVELKTHLKPLLRYAEKVSLIDPYLTCRNERFFNIVQCCAGQCYYPRAAYFVDNDLVVDHRPGP